MSVSNRIKELRERAGLSQIELANMVGVDANTVWRWENDRSSPSRSIQSLASALKTSVAYLMGETNDPAPPRSFFSALADANLSNIAPVNPVHMIRVRVLDRSWKICCGNGIDWGAEAVDYEKTLLLPLSDLATRYGDEDVIGVYAEGDSMDPKVKDGDLVLFVPHEKAISYAGIPMVVCYNGKMMVRGLIENSRRQLTMRAFNRDYEDVVVTDDDDFIICGKVVKIFSIRDPESVL